MLSKMLKGKGEGREEGSGERRGGTFVGLEGHLPLDRAYMCYQWVGFNKGR